MTDSALSTRDDAVARAERIRAGIRSMTELQQDLSEAYHARDWETLGYGSWDAYVTGEFGGSLPRLDRTERRELVVHLRAEGLSTRAIASATGAGVGTVHRELSGVPNGTPETQPVTGVDGKTYESRQPQSAEEEEVVKPQPKAGNRRPPLADFARQAGWDLRKAVERLERIAEDDRFQANKEKVAAHLHSHLVHAIETCTQLVERITEQKEA